MMSTSFLFYELLVVGFPKLVQSNLQKTPASETQQSFPLEQSNPAKSNEEAWSLGAPIFHKAVVLITEHEDDYSKGPLWSARSVGFSEDSQENRPQSDVKMFCSRRLAGHMNNLHFTVVWFGLCAK